MAGLQDLPNEIIYQILSILYAECFDNRRYLDHRSVPRLNDFLNIALVCRRLLENAEPLIYRVVDTGNSDSPKQKNKRPWNILRTILARPYLGTYIKTINIRWLSGANRKARAKDHKLFAAAAEKAGLELAVKSEEDQVRLLSYLLPNVEDLLISYPMDFRVYTGDPFTLLRDYSLSFFDKATVASPALSMVGMQNIQRLTINPEFNISIHNIAPMLLLPNLRSFTAYHVYTNTKLRLNPEWHRASSVTQLRLLDSELDGHTLAVIFRMIRALTLLEYTDTGGRFKHTHAKSEEFKQALEILKPTLQHLKVSLEMVRTEDGLQVTVGSLRGFPALISVSCNYGAIRGPSFLTVLPGTLEVFEVWFPWEFDPCYDRLGEMFREKETAFSRLKLVQIYPQGLLKWGTWERVARFRAQARMAGVNVRVINTPN